MTQVLTVEEIKAAARKWYDEGRLMSEFCAPVGTYSKQINGVEYRCAIGAALTDETIQALRDRKALTKRFGCLPPSIVRAASPEDEAIIENIQLAHDRWAARIAGREFFLALIDHPDAPDA